MEVVLIRKIWFSRELGEHIWPTFLTNCEHEAASVAIASNCKSEVEVADYMLKS